MRIVLGLVTGAWLFGAATAQAQAPLPVLPLVVHVAQVDGAPIVDEAWVATQVAAANQIYAPQAMSFRLEQVVPLTQPAIAELRSRDDRDSLGVANLPGVVNVYIVAYLADVDASGERRGVHWRVRRGRGRHLVIVSRAGAGSTLAHELGHFFGLPHSQVVNDLMSYTRTGAPFLSDVQGATMRDRARRFLHARELRAATPDA